MFQTDEKPEETAIDYVVERKGRGRGAGDEELRKDEGQSNLSSMLVRRKKGGRPARLVRDYPQESGQLQGLTQARSDHAQGLNILNTER